jgi:hypothetical protein
MEREETLAALTAGDAATLGELATADDVALTCRISRQRICSLPCRMTQSWPSPFDTPTQSSSNDVSGAPEAMREAPPGDTTATTDAAGDAPTDAHEAPSKLDISVD